MKIINSLYKLPKYEHDVDRKDMANEGKTREDVQDASNLKRKKLWRMYKI